MQSVQPNSPFRVKVLKGFYAHVQGQFRVVNPGDVVELDRQTATMMIASAKASSTTEEAKIESNYLPDRKRHPKPDPQTLLQSLVAAVEANTKAIAALVGKSGKAEK